MMSHFLFFPPNSLKIIDKTPPPPPGGGGSCNPEKYKPLTVTLIQFDLFVNLGDVVTVCGVVKVVADEASARNRKINY